jgi:hypothetical protein
MNTMTAEELAAHVDDMLVSNWRLGFSSQRDKRAEQFAWLAHVLTGLYAHYNHAYFGDRLPPFRIVVTDDFGDVRFSTRGRYEKATRTIWMYVLDRIWTEGLRLTLIHEMVHVSIGNGWHGKRFRAEIHRIAEMGNEDAAYEDWTLDPGASRTFRSADEKNQWQARSKRAVDWGGDDPDLFDEEGHFLLSEEDDPDLRRVGDLMSRGAPSAPSRGGPGHRGRQ